MSFGIVATPRVLCARQEVEELGVNKLRAIVYHVDDIARLLSTCPPHCKLHIVLNNECAQVGGGWGGWQATLQMIADRYRGTALDAVECGNELDRWWAQRKDDVPPEFGAQLVMQAVPILHAASIQVFTASVAGPRWQEWIAKCIQNGGGVADGVALHPYGQRPDGFDLDVPFTWFGDMSAAIYRAHELSGLPVELTEFGVKRSDVGGDEGQRVYAECAVRTVASIPPDVCTGGSYFAWHDGVGATHEQGVHSFGLRELVTGRARPARQAYIDAVFDVRDDEPVPPDLSGELRAWGQLWRAVVPNLLWDAAIAEYAIPRYWRAHFKELGSPVGPEEAEEGGTTLQAFTGGIVRWRGGDVVERVV